MQSVTVKVDPLPTESMPLNLLHYALPVILILILTWLILCPDFCENWQVIEPSGSRLKFPLIIAELLVI